MRFRYTLAFALLPWLAGCDSILDTKPTDQLPQDRAITSAEGARAALTGAYSALQDFDIGIRYYGGDFSLLGDLSSDNADNTGTSTSFADADANQLRAANATVGGIWAAIYRAINRSNNIIEKVPALTDLDDTEKNEILGEAYFLRALDYHNLVKFWGPVPLRLETVKSVDEAADIVRAPVADVYAQINSDLAQADQLITSTSPTTRATSGAVKAIQARVYLYQGDWANANAKADEVIGLGYTLADAYSDLFDEEGQETPEDIFKILFTAQQYENMGYYYHSTDDGGTADLTPTQSLIDTYDPDDERLAWSILDDGAGTISGVKFPTVAGAEDFHVIRFAEILLIKAEALARLSDLAGAVDAYNPIRVRAGLPEHVLGNDVTTQDEVLAAIDRERRIELAFEGDRWPDLVRRGVAVSVMGIPDFQTLYPIPQAEVDVAPGLTQNPGY
ncbi:MAG: RagB/SusD family nutrient uptake outer membrane protein [Gemmatimonadales bacterium]